MNLILVSFYRTEPKSPFINGTDAVRRNRRHPMKMILAAAAFAALIASPLYAQSPRYEGPVSGIYLNQQKRFGVNNRSLPAPRFNQNATDDSLCSTAPDFCANNAHGENYNGG
jgi:hypothetical protein